MLWSSLSAEIWYLAGSNGVHTHLSTYNASSQKQSYCSQMILIAMVCVYASNEKEIMRYFSQMTLLL